VWVALQRSADVTLKVFDSANTGTILLQATRKTTAVGKNLHIVAVTARTDTTLVLGKIYGYDLTFLDQGAPIGLDKAVTAPGQPLVVHAFSYAPLTFPSFALPPNDLNSVRLIHGSCRKPHGGGPVAPDGLATLSTLIADSANDPMQRPH